MVKVFADYNFFNVNMKGVGNEFWIRYGVFGREKGQFWEQF